MKTKDILEELYDLFQEKRQYGMDDIEILKAKNKIAGLLDNTDNEDAILDYGTAYEKAGFRYGFMLAVHIMSRCISEVPIHIA